MSTTTTLLWSDLFDDKILLPNFKNTLVQVASSLEDDVTLDKKPGIIVLLKKEDHALDEIIRSASNISKSFNELKQKINGHAHEFKFSCITLPERKTDTEQVITALKQARWKEKHASPLGDAVYRELLEKNELYPSLVVQSITHINFSPLTYLKDDGTIGFYDIPVPHDSEGIYCIRETVPENPFTKIVYVGKSISRITQTIKCHFRDWNGKYHYKYTQVRHDRGEDRGQWIEKVKSGEASYEIGILTISKPENVKHELFDRNIRRIEKYFIHILNPRDNKEHKLTEIAEEHKLFNQLNEPTLYDPLSPTSDEDLENQPF